MELLVVTCLMDSGVLIMAEMGESASYNRHRHCERGQRVNDWERVNKQHVNKQ